MPGYVPQNRGNKSTNRVGATVSRRLRKAGFNVIAKDNRRVNQCLTVSGKTGTATISVDYGIPSKNDRVAGELIDELLTWDQVPGNGIDTHVAECGAILIWVEYTPSK